MEVLATASLAQNPIMPPNTTCNANEPQKMVFECLIRFSAVSDFGVDGFYCVTIFSKVCCMIP